MTIIYSYCKSYLYLLFKQLPPKKPMPALVRFQNGKTVRGYLYKEEPRVFFLHDCPDYSGSRPNNFHTLPGECSWYLFKAKDTEGVYCIDGEFEEISISGYLNIGEL